MTTILPTIRRANWLFAVVLPVVVACGCRSTTPVQRSAESAAATPPVGASLDDIDARNRADISAQLGRQVAPGPATPAEVVAMSRAGIDSRYIVCYINRSTSMPPVTAQDVIYMHD